MRNSIILPEWAADTHIKERRMESERQKEGKQVPSDANVPYCLSVYSSPRYGTAAPYPQTPPWSHFTHVPQSVEWGLIVHNGYKYLLQKWAPQKHHHNNIIFRSDVTFKLLISFVSIKILVISLLLQWILKKSMSSKKKYSEEELLK